MIIHEHLWNLDIDSTDKHNSTTKFLILNVHNLFPLLTCDVFNCLFICIGHLEAKRKVRILLVYVVIIIVIKCCLLSLVGVRNIF